MSRRILVIGAYGEAGRALGDAVLEHTSAELVVGGRDEAKLAAEVERLGTVGGSGATDRVSSLLVDIGESASLKTALGTVDVAVLAAPTQGVSGVVVNAAIAGGADLVDISLWPATRDAWTTANAVLAAAGRCVVHQAGILPGLPGVMVGYAAQRLDPGAAIVLGEGMRFEPNASLGALEELIGGLRMRSHVYFDGAWRRPGKRTRRELELPEPFGVQRGYAYDLLELRSLPDRYELAELGIYAGGFGGSADTWIGVGLMLGLNRVPGLRRWLSRRVLKALRAHSQPPYGIVVQLDAEGTIDGRPATYSLRLGHEQPYLATAIAVVAALRQLADDGRRRPGALVMGDWLDPERAVADAVDMGLTIEETLDGTRSVEAP